MQNRTRDNPYACPSFCRESEGSWGIHLAFLSTAVILSICSGGKYVLETTWKRSPAPKLFQCQVPPLSDIFAIINNALIILIIIIILEFSWFGFLWIYCVFDLWFPWFFSMLVNSLLYLLAFDWELYRLKYHSFFIILISISNNNQAIIQ